MATTNHEVKGSIYILPFLGTQDLPAEIAISVPIIQMTGHVKITEEKEFNIAGVVADNEKEVSMGGAVEDYEKTSEFNISGQVHTPSSELYMGGLFPELECELSMGGFIADPIKELTMFGVIPDGPEEGGISSKFSARFEIAENDLFFNARFEIDDSAYDGCKFSARWEILESSTYFNARWEIYSPEASFSVRWEIAEVTKTFSARFEIGGGERKSSFTMTGLLGEFGSLLLYLDSDCTDEISKKNTGYTNPIWGGYEWDEETLVRSMQLWVKNIGDTQTLNAFIDSVDEYGISHTWTKIALTYEDLDTGNQTLSIGTLDPDEIITFWIKTTIPEETGFPQLYRDAFMRARWQLL